MDMESIIDDLEILNDENFSYEELNILKIYIDDINKYPLLTRDQEIELFKKFHNGDMNAREILINSNLRLVASIAHKCLSKYKYHFLNESDVIQEGTFGLINAIDKFKLNKNCKLSTYATYHILARIYKALYNTKPINRTSHVVELQNKINKYIDKYFDENEKTPTDEELAKAFGIKYEKLDLVKNRDYAIVSFDDTVSFDSKMMLKDVISDDAENFQEIICQTILRKELIKLIKNKLSENQAKVILLRYFNENGKMRTMSEVGKIMNITRQRVEQIEKKAFEIIERLLKQRKLYEDEINYLKKKTK